LNFGDSKLIFRFFGLPSGLNPHKSKEAFPGASSSMACLEALNRLSGLSRWLSPCF
jgi:hypothetical protein